MVMRQMMYRRVHASLLLAGMVGAVDHEVPPGRELCPVVLRS